MKQSLSAPILFTVACLVIAGCAEPESKVPPVMNVLKDMREIDEKRKADDIARRAEVILQQQAENPEVPQRGNYVVEFETTAGNFTIEVNREWAPMGADRFYKLVKDGFYTNAAFFRVMPGFMVQWGIAARPGMTLKWDDPIRDDPVIKSNSRGYISFAQLNTPHSRTGQVFINYGDNPDLDTNNQGFAPFGRVIEGMENVEKINAQYRQKPDQGQIRARGNAYLKENFPGLDYIRSTRFLIDDQRDTPDAEDDESGKSKIESEQ